MIESRRTSIDKKLALTFNLCNKQHTLFVKEQDLYPRCFIAFIYENLWCFGIVSEVNAEDVTVKVLHPRGPSLSSDPREKMHVQYSCNCYCEASKNNEWKNLPIH